MALKKHIHTWLRLINALLCMVLFCSAVAAQASGCKSTFQNNELLIEIPKSTNATQLADFIQTYDLKELNLPVVLKTNKLDTLRKLGWKIKRNDDQRLILTKPLSGAANLDNPADNISIAISSPTISQRFPVNGNGVQYGYNQFRNKKAFTVKDGVTTFYLRNHLHAYDVVLAGSFNDFSPERLHMKKTDSGWVALVKLSPGKYWYKFVADGNWMIDEDNTLRENDGEGNTNSVYYQPNVVFTYHGFTTASKAYLCGSFNNWSKRELPMTKTNTGWQLPLYLANGTHTYKYYIDNQYYEEPGRKDKLPDGKGGFNAVVRIGTPYLFQLQGYTNARQVVLSGTFNKWRTDELYLTKTSTGWQLPYTLGNGNYQYKFIVDGNWILDPANALTASLDGQTNSFLMVGSNYTFRLKGMQNAKTVYVAGDFNNWTPRALALKKQGGEWICPIYLSPGKHTYKFIVDGNWILDPTNKNWEQNEFGTGNSVIWVE